MTYVSTIRRAEGQKGQKGQKGQNVELTLFTLYNMMFVAKMLRIIFCLNIANLWL